MYKGVTFKTKKITICSLVGISLTTLLLSGCSGNQSNKTSIATPSLKQTPFRAPLHLKH